MTFIDLYFWICLFLVICIYAVLPNKGRALLLLGFSLIFYTSLNSKFLLPLFAILVCDYLSALLIQRTSSKIAKKTYLAIGILLNIGVLFYYKFSFTTNAWLRDILGYDFNFINPLMPIGISFYTFQSISYLFDVYDKEIKAETNFFKYTLYVTFFPQLVLGPIEKAKDLMPQLDFLRLPENSEILKAAHYILFGLVKKIVFADRLYIFIDALKPNEQTSIYQLILYCNIITLRVYLDFSAYSEIARGLGLLFGIRLRENFRPYFFSKNPAEFWQRWHLSLTSWVRTYLFLRMAPYKSGKLRTYFILFVSFVIIGVWHGAGVNWLLFGIFHGAAFIGYRLIKKHLPDWPVAISFSLMILFYAVCGYLHELAFNETLADVTSNVMTNLVPESELWRSLLTLIIFIMPIFIYEYFVEKSDDGLPALKLSSFGRFTCGLCLFLLILFFGSNNKAFIYFNF